MKKICIIDYGLGNVASIYNAVEYLDRNVRLSRNPDDIKKATHLILPGVGSYKTGMDNLFKYDLVEILNSQVITKKKPFLGICLGMQLLSTSSTEGGPQKGLNWINGEVIKIISNDKNIKVPHMGWNSVKHTNNSGLFKNIKNSSSFYFVHSYHFVPEDKSIITGTCFHGVEISSSLQKENIFATQFHPEKSHNVGTELLKNFLNY